jgi:hypothetical protein
VATGTEEASRFAVRDPKPTLAPEKVREKPLEKANKLFLGM